MSVVMIFVDGIGIGVFDVEKNPLARFPSPFFSHFTDHKINSVPYNGQVISTDPSMDVPGLPQSATGQTALLTGINAAKSLGRHSSGFPTPTLRKILREESIFLRLEQMNKVATFANAFTPEYFSRPDRQISTTTWSVKASSFPFRMVHNDLVDDKAISHDLTNEFLFKLGYSVPIRIPETSAEILVQIAESADFCLFEYILTDIIGHQQDMLWAKSELNKLNIFINTVLSRIDLNEHLVVVTSDHGNFEDLSRSTHTHNLVPTMLWGNDKMRISAIIKCMEDVPQAILSYFKSINL